MSATQGLYCLFLWLMTAGGFVDIFSYRIPNRINAAAALIFPLLILSGGLTFSNALINIAFGAVVLVFTYVLFFMNVFGGGDAKMLAVTALWLGPETWLTFMFNVSLLALFGSFLLILLRSMPLPPRCCLHPMTYGLYDGCDGDRRSIPYGAAIAAGLLFTTPQILPT